MSKKYLIDTGVLKRFYAEEIKLPDDVLSYGCISVVTKIELYNWLSNYQRIDKTKRTRIFKAIKGFPVKHFNESISRLVELYADKNINTKPADTIIGVTAQYYNLLLHTGDKDDFNIFNIDKLYYPQPKSKRISKRKS